MVSIQAMSFFLAGNGFIRTVGIEGSIGIIRMVCIWKRNGFFWISGLDKNQERLIFKYLLDFVANFLFNLIGLGPYMRAGKTLGNNYDCYDQS